MAESKLTKEQARFLTAIESGDVQPVANLDEGVTRKAMLWLGLPVLTDGPLSDGGRG